jgi:hypothetical protein
VPDSQPPDRPAAVRTLAVAAVEGLPQALAALGLRAPRPVVVVVGGASGLSAEDQQRLRPLFTQALVPALERHGAVAVDGGTRAGVMQLLGRARTAASAAFPLVGVAAEGTVRLPGAAPGDAARDDAAELDPDHTHLVLVPGTRWGDESPWIARTATALAGAAGSVTVLVDGGRVAWQDVRSSVDAGRPVVAVDGSGRTADALAAAVRGAAADDAARDLVGSGLVRAVALGDLAGLAAVLDDHLARTGTEHAPPP